MRWVFLGLAIIGVYPWVFFWRWFQTEGWSLSHLGDAWRANLASHGMLWDLIIAASALTLWILWESWQRRDWHRLWAIPATWGIGVSCGLPLYLFLRMSRNGPDAAQRGSR